MTARTRCSVRRRRQRGQRQHVDCDVQLRLNSANANAKGIVTNGTHLWVVNDTQPTDKVFKYTTVRHAASARGRSIPATAARPASRSIRRTSTTSGSSTARTTRCTATTPRPAAPPAARRPRSLFQLASGNIDAQGIADPPPVALEIGLPDPSNDAEATLFALPNEACRAESKDRAFGDWSRYDMEPTAGRCDSHLSALRSSCKRFSRRRFALAAPDLTTASNGSAKAKCANLDRLATTLSRAEVRVGGRFRVRR